MPSPLLVTVDTNVLDVDRFKLLRDATRDRVVEFATVSVNDRERGSYSVDTDVVPETALWREFRWGEVVWGLPRRSRRSGERVRRWGLARFARR